MQGVDLAPGVYFNQTRVTGPGGYAVFDGLYPGAYLVTEIRAPITHNTDAPPQTVNIQSNETLEIFFDNTRRQGLNILKVGPEGRLLAGAVFEFTRGGGDLMGTFITDKNGQNGGRR